MGARVGDDPLPEPGRRGDSVAERDFDRAVLVGFRGPLRRSGAQSGLRRKDGPNRSIVGANLIPVAVARDIRQTAPVSGAYAGSSDALESMSVEILVTSSAAPSSPQSNLGVSAAPDGADRFSA